MRKILYVLPPIALLLCLALALMMTGVLHFPQILPPVSSAQGTSGSTAAPAASTTTVAGAQDWVRQNMVSLSLPEIHDTVVSSDGVTLLRHTFQDVVLSSPNPRINEAVTLDLLKRMDVNASTVAILEDLTQYYTPGTVWNTLYYELLYTPTRIDDTVLSLKGEEGIYSGSGQAGNTVVCVNYYMPTGSAMTLSQTLSEESSAQDGLLQALLRVLAQNAVQWGLFEDYSEPVIRYFPSYLQQESIWYLSQEGLNICFAPYEIAPQSSGTVIATIPYEDLTGILRSDLLPEEKSRAAASPVITELSAAPLDRYTHFAECLLAAEGKNHLITTDTILYDVRLELGALTEDGSFLPTSTVFAANSLCSDQAIRLCWDPAIHHLRLQCVAGGKAQGFLLAVNTDGSIALQKTS